MKRFDLEVAALREVELARIEQRDPRELVAIGFKFTWADGTVWRELPNTALRNDQFHVTADDLYDVLKQVRAEYGIERTDAVEKVSLWHSHNVHEKPSSLDIQEFPEHLASVGIVYHTPTRTSSYYNQSGEIPALVQSSPRTTEAIS